jgi:hypothetical protein
MQVKDVKHCLLFPPNTWMKQNFQHFQQIGCLLSLSAGHDELGRSASACVGEVPLLVIYCSYTVYMLYIQCICIVYTD